MTKLPKFLALAALLAGCGDFARTGLQPPDIFYFPTGMAVGHVPAGCTGGSAGCQTRLYVASSNFDLRYDLKTGGTLTVVDPDTSRRVGAPVPMGSFAGDVALVEPSTCPGWSGDPLLLVASRSSSLLYGMPVAADGSASCNGCGKALDIHLTDPFNIAVSCRGADGVLAWVDFLAPYQSFGWIQPVPLPFLPPETPEEKVPKATVGAINPPPQAIAYDPNTQRLYYLSSYGGPVSNLYFLDVREYQSGRSTSLAVTGEASGLAISSDGTRAYVAMRLFNALVASSTARPGDLGGALLVVDLTEQPGGGPSGTLLRLVPMGLGPTVVKVVDRRALGMKDLVAVTCTDDSTFHLYDDEVGAVLQVVGANDRGVPLLGHRIYGLAVETPYQTATSTNAIRYFVGSFDDGTVSTVVVDDPANPGSVSVHPSAVTPGDP